jgi:hypothetical protein
MSYDLMVFDLTSAPSAPQQFMAWYEQQTQWSESHSYDNPAVSTPELRAWFQDMIQRFPAMNGPYAVDDPDNPKVSDYCVGKSVIYVAFAWSQAEDARQTMFALAQQHHVGFYDLSAEGGGVWRPDPSGTLIRSSSPETPERTSKPWWQFWK